MCLNIAEIRDHVSTLGTSISAPISYLNIPDRSVFDGTPYVEIINEEYHYVSAERGMEISRKTTHDVDELLYWIFKRVASAMASTYEFQNRVDGCDSRRKKFAKQIEIMERLHPKWGRLMQGEIEEILKNSPYDDFSDDRVKLCKKLMDKGLSGEQAYEKACEKFPLPK